MIAYHTRRDGADSDKLVAGFVAGSFDMETVNRLVAGDFTVAVTASGRAVFVDRAGRQVQLHLTVDAGATEKGRAALLAWRAERAAQAQRERDQADTQVAELAQAMEGLSHAEILRRLSSGVVLTGAAFAFEHELLQGARRDRR